MARSDAQALAYKFLHEDEDRLPPEQQQSFIDLRRSRKEAEKLEKAMVEKGIDPSVKELPQQADVLEDHEEVTVEPLPIQDKENEEIEDGQGENVTEEDDQVPAKKQKIDESVVDPTPTES